MIEKIGMDDKLTLRVIRDGKVTQEVTPISDAGFVGKLMNVLGLKEYTTDLVTTVGIQSITTGISTDFTHCAYGTGTDAPARGDTALGTEVARGAATVTTTTTTVADDTVNFAIEFTIGGTYAITEAGIFSASTGGDMFARQTFSALNLVSGDKLSLSWDVVIS